MLQSGAHTEKVSAEPSANVTSEAVSVVPNITCGGLGRAGAARSDTADGWAVASSEEAAVPMAGPVPAGGLDPGGEGHRTDKLLLDGAGSGP